MPHCVFMHKADSIYDDIPAERYQFPAMYFTRAEPCIGDWIVYLEPTKVRNSRGYFAVAKVEKIIPDPTAPGMFLALIEPGTYLDFVNPVPFSGSEGPIERGVLNEAGAISGRAQAAVRPLSRLDFARILNAGLPEDDTLPRVGELDPRATENEWRVHEPHVPFDFERPIVQTLLNRPFRDRAFRRAVLHAYDGRCAVTGWKLVNGRGRLEAEAAHIKPVAEGGPDSLRNGLALSGTAHWMFDRGLIGLSDELDILVSRQVNDPASVTAMINPTRKALVPGREAERPHPQFLAWHREHCFKH